MCALLLAIVAGTIADNSDVIELNADNFKDRIADESIILVEFFAPWYVGAMTNHSIAYLPTNYAGVVTARN